MRKLTQEEWINKSIKVHGYRYNYSRVNYVNARTKVCIICAEHGDFLQNPADHLNGRGCPKCGFKIISKTNFGTLDIFI